MAIFSKTLDKLKGAFKKTWQVLNTDVGTLFIPGRQIDDAFLTEVEEKLIRADMGVTRVESLVVAVRAQWQAGKRSEIAVPNLPHLGGPDVIGHVVEAQPGEIGRADLAVDPLVLPHPEHLAINKSHHRQAEYGRRHHHLGEC